MLDEKAARTLLESAVTDVNTPSPSIDALLARGRSARNRWRVLPAMGAVLLALMFVGVATADFFYDRGTVSGQPLNVDATPEQVVQTYVAALNARDKATALSLLTPKEAESLQASEGGPFGDNGPFGLRRAKPITDLRLGTPDAKYPRDSGGSSADGWQQAVFLRATYQRDGEEKIWGYMLVRNSDTERWLIAGQGKG